MSASLAMLIESDALATNENSHTSTGTTDGFYYRAEVWAG